jgi:hypothetical protein
MADHENERTIMFKFNIKITIFSSVQIQNTGYVLCGQFALPPPLRLNSTRYVVIVR